MVVFLNNKELVVATSTTIASLLFSQEIPQKGIAVACNNKVIARDLWADYALSESDKVTIIVATFGG